MKNPVVVAINNLRKLTPEQYRLAVAVTKEFAGVKVVTAKARKKPGPKPGSKRIAKAEVEAKFPKAEAK